VTEALVRHVAGLARLALTDAEVASMTKELGRILGHVEAVSRIDVAGVDPAAAPGVAYGALREDEPQPGLSREDALKNAPAQDGVFFLVPKVLGE
jgi:aspartyl-tRNA(Asn)/glutamyl-tRNA(Gln) amidotransferase subunit C